MENLQVARKRLALEQEKLEVDRALIREEKKHLRQLQSYQQEELDSCRAKIKDLESKLSSQKKEHASQETVVRELEMLISQQQEEMERLEQANRETETKWKEKVSFEQKERAVQEAVVRELEMLISQQQEEMERLEQENRETETKWREKLDDLQAELAAEREAYIKHVEAQLERCNRSYQDERLQLEATIERLRSNTDGQNESGGPPTDDDSISDEVKPPTDVEAKHTIISASKENKGGVIMAEEEEVEQSATQEEPTPAPEPTPLLGDECESTSIVVSVETNDELVKGSTEDQQSAPMSDGASQTIDSPTEKNGDLFLKDSELEQSTTQEVSPEPELTPTSIDECKREYAKDIMVKDSAIRYESSTPNLTPPESIQTEGPSSLTKGEEQASFISEEVDIHAMDEGDTSQTNEKGKLVKDAYVDQSECCPETSPASNRPPPGISQVTGPDCRSLHVYLDTERDHASVKGIEELLDNNMSREMNEESSQQQPVEENRDGKLAQMLEEKDDEGRLPIHVACLYKAPLEVIRFLATKSHDSLRTKDSYGWHPIHVAIRYHDDSSVIQCLLDKDPETISEKDGEGLNCLELAMQYKASEEICNLLKQSYDFLGRPLPRADAIDIWDEAMDEIANDIPMAEVLSNDAQRQAPSMALDSRFFERVATKSHRGKTLEAYKAVHNRSTMVLFSTKTKTPLASLTLTAEDLGCLSMLTARPPPKGAAEAYFQGMLNSVDQPFTLTISNLSDEGMINFDVLHSPCSASQVSPGPDYAINETSILYPSQSQVIQNDQRNHCQMILGGMTRKPKFPALSRKKEVPVTVKQAERKSEGLNFHLNVVPESDCASLVDKFAEGTVWKVVPGFVRRVSMLANVQPCTQDEVESTTPLPKPPAEEALQVVELAVVSKWKSSMDHVDVTSTQAAVLKHGANISHLRSDGMLRSNDNVDCGRGGESSKEDYKTGTLKPNNQNMDIGYIPDNVAIGVMMPKEEHGEDASSSVNEEDEGVAELPDDVWQNNYLEREACNVVPAKKKLALPSFKKPGRLMARRLKTKAAAAMEEQPNERSLKPPGAYKYLQPASRALPTLSDLPPLHDGEARGRGPIDEFEIDQGAPPKVPLEEQVTIGSEFINTSDRFEPRVAEHDDGSLLEDTDTIGQNTAGPTVASSTYGEDRMVVKDQMVLDPYGDKGVYSGQVLFSTGLPHGSGIMIYEDDGRTYDGDWRHGRWHGWGRATFSNGDAFEGFYKYDQRHGHGKYAWNDGRSYEGDFKEDKRHGKGHFIWPDGAEYTGDFRNGQREGHGAYRYSDGGRYEGEWINGRYEGKGRCEWRDGRTYEGEWKAGMAHGVGVETYSDGRVRHLGKWIQDEPDRDESQASEISSSRTRSKPRFDAEHASEPAVLSMSIWKDMKFVAMTNSIEVQIAETVLSMVKNEGKALIQSSRAIVRAEYCSIDGNSVADTIVCTCGHQCLNHKNVINLYPYQCPICSEPVTAFVRADGLVIE